MSEVDRLSMEDVRASLWFWPSVAAVVALGAAVGLAEVAPGPDSALGRLPWPADVDAASTVLQVVSTSIITVTSLTFSLVVVALQLASQQFSPRLLREFARDWVIQVVLAILVSTFVFSLTILIGMGSDEPVPRLAVLLAFALGLLSIAALLAFLGHLVRALRIDTMMAAVHRETAATIVQTYAEVDEAEPRRPDDVPGPSGGTVLPARRSGFVKVVTPERLVRAASEADVVVWMMVRPGDHLVVGTPLGVVCHLDGSPVPPSAVGSLARSVLEAVELGYERTSEQDVAFGLRQLVDVAVKALSPGINDPVTAAHAVGYCSDLLVRLQGRRIAPEVHVDSAGTARAVLPGRSSRYYLDLVCQQVRRYGRREPTVLTALLRMLRDVAVSVHDATQAAEVRRQTRLVVAEMSDDLLPEDAAIVHAMAERVELALAGRHLEAFDDEAGETRSL